MIMVSRPLFVPPGDRGGGVRARADDTGGVLGLVETVIPRGHSTALHVHRDEDEAFYVLSGTVDFVCGDAEFRAEAGAFAYLPRGVPHTFLGVSAEPARVLVLLLPGGLEQAFDQPARFHELLRRHHVEVVGPTLAQRSEPSDSGRPRT
jgi:mannose-6-phosphate isomerase-like protein (cupin superfamily)